MTIDINELREAIQTFGSQAINEGGLNELLDRLELTESREAVYKKAFEISENTSRDLTEKVIPNIRNQLEAAERDIALKERVVDSLGSELNAVANERDELRARIEEMEKQEPYAFAVAFPESSRVELAHDLDDLCEDMTNEAHEVRKLYLTPGAQPAPSMLIEPTQGMMRGAHRLVAAARRVLASADSQGLIRLDESGGVASELRSALAAAPEAKP